MFFDLRFTMKLSSSGYLVNNKLYCTGTCSTIHTMFCRS